MNKYSVPLQQLAEEFNLTVAYRATDYDEIRILVDEVSRPGLPLTGFFEHFEALRMEVLGYVEMTYLDAQSREKRLEIFDRLFAYKIPALVISRGQSPSRTPPRNRSPRIRQPLCLEHRAVEPPRLCGPSG